MSVVLSEYVPVRKSALAKAARRWGGVNVVHGAKRETPRILTHPTYWRDRAAANRTCHMCKGSGEIWVEISAYEQEREPCPACTADERGYDDGLEPPF